MIVPPTSSRESIHSTQNSSIGRLLVVDDLEANRRILRGLLQRFGYEIAEAEDGEVALNMIEEEDYDTILLDIMMPKMDGYEVCNRLKSDLRTEHIPVLLVTALCDRESRLKGMQAGADEFLSKPFDSKYLPIRIQNAVRAKRLHDQVEDNYLQLSRSEQARNALVQTIVHDLRSPLCSIQGSLDLHERAEEPNEAKRHIVHARSEARRMNAMVNDLLDVHRFEAGEIVVNPSTCRVTTLVGEAAKALDNSTEINRLQLQLSSPDLTCHADHDILIRVLRNLFSHAISVSPETAPITIIGSTLADHSVRIEIHDSGPIIPTDVRESMFEKFNQVSDHAKASSARTGLGLAYCKLAIEAHGGSIGIDEGVSNGNDFWLTLPAASEQESLTG